MFKDITGFLRVKEPLTAGIHAVGGALAVAGTVHLFLRASADNEFIGLVFGLSLVVLFVSSTLVHGLNTTPARERLLEKFDYAAIYLLIAATYTPVCMIALPASICNYLLIAEWSMAALGIAITFWRGWGPRYMQVILFLVMGWLFALNLPTLVRVLNDEVMNWLIAGGVCYTVGALVFLFDKPHPWSGRITAHDVWHTLVLGGTICHFNMVAVLMK